MRLKFLRHQFKDRFIIQPLLLRLAQPGFAQRQEPANIIAGNHVVAKSARGSQQTQFRLCIQRASDRQTGFLLEGPQGSARLGTDDSID